MYNVPELAEFIRLNHNTIPEHLVEVIVLAASAGAWHVAKRHFLVNGICIPLLLTNTVIMILCSYDLPLYIQHES